MKDKLTVPHLEKGLYEHYKGNRYEVVGVAMHEEEIVPLVIYRPLYESSVELWARPFDVFTETIEVDGAVVSRFKKI